MSIASESSVTRTQPHTPQRSAPRGLVGALRSLRTDFRSAPFTLSHLGMCPLALCVAQIIRERMMDRAGGRRRGKSSLHFSEALKSWAPDRARADPIFATRRCRDPGSARTRRYIGPDCVCRAARDRRLVTGVDRRGVGDAWRGALEPARPLAPPRIGYLSPLRSPELGRRSVELERGGAVHRTPHAIRLPATHKTLQRSLHLRETLNTTADHDVITMMPVRAPHDAMSSVGSARARREISMSSDM